MLYIITAMWRANAHGRLSSEVRRVKSCHPYGDVALSSEVRRVKSCHPYGDVALSSEVRRVKSCHPYGDVALWPFPFLCLGE